MIRVWMAGLAAHSLTSIGLVVLSLIRTSERGVDWLPDRSPLIIATVLVLFAGPVLGFVIALAGPRPPGRPDEEQWRRAGRRIRNIAGWLLVFPLMLVLGAILRNPGSSLPAWAAVVGVCAAALLVLLAPWIALYGRWFTAA